jgi:hypothetical protein
VRTVVVTLEALGLVGRQVESLSRLR